MTTHCVCGHEADDHTHYRRGTDCGTCGPTRCPWFESKRILTPLGRLRAWFYVWTHQ